MRNIIIYISILFLSPISLFASSIEIITPEIDNNKINNLSPYFPMKADIHSYNQIHKFQIFLNDDMEHEKIYEIQDNVYEINYTRDYDTVHSKTLNIGQNIFLIYVEDYKGIKAKKKFYINYDGNVKDNKLTNIKTDDIMINKAPLIKDLNTSANDTDKSVALFKNSNISLNMISPKSDYTETNSPDFILEFDIVSLYPIKELMVDYNGKNFYKRYYSENPNNKEIPFKNYQVNDNGIKNVYPLLEDKDVNIHITVIDYSNGSIEKDFKVLYISGKEQTQNIEVKPTEKPKEEISESKNESKQEAKPTNNDSKNNVPKSPPLNPAPMKSETISTKTNKDDATLFVDIFLQGDGLSYFSDYSENLASYGMGGLLDIYFRFPVFPYAGLGIRTGYFIIDSATSSLIKYSLSHTPIILLVKGLYTFDSGFEIWAAGGFGFSLYKIDFDTANVNDLSGSNFVFCGDIGVDYKINEMLGIFTSISYNYFYFSDDNVSMTKLHALNYGIGVSLSL